MITDHEDKIKRPEVTCSLQIIQTDAVPVVVSPDVDVRTVVVLGARRLLMEPFVSTH